MSSGLVISLSSAMSYLITSAVLGTIKCRKVTGRQVLALPMGCIHVSSQLTTLMHGHGHVPHLAIVLTAREMLIRIIL